MSITIVLDLIKQKGFRDVFSILARNNRPMKRRDFYRKLNEDSYYNSFFRIREELLSHELIKTEKRNDENFIILTRKGREFYNKLGEMSAILTKS